MLSFKYYQLSNDDFEIRKEVAERNGILLVDMFNLVEMMNPNYFSDEKHLNDTGARKFFRLLIDKKYSFTEVGLYLKIFEHENF